jgi:hypothetical protein
LVLLRYVLWLRKITAQTEWVYALVQFRHLPVTEEKHETCLLHVARG